MVGETRVTALVSYHNLYVGELMSLYQHKNRRDRYTLGGDDGSEHSDINVDYTEKSDTEHVIQLGGRGLGERGDGCDVI